MSNTNPNKKEQRFIYFDNKLVGKSIKARINLSSLIKYAKQNRDGDWIFDFFIARRKKPVKSKYYIAWTEFELQENKDNSDMVEKLFTGKETPSV